MNAQLFIGHKIIICMRPGKTTHIFQLGDYSVKFSGNFDSGNLRNVLQVAPFYYEIEPAFDSYDFPSTSKVFFHFYFEGFPKGTNLQLSFKNIALLATLKEDAYRYKPFQSLDGSNYQRLTEQQVEIRQQNEGLTLILNLKANENRVYLSFALPYSYERYLNMIRDLPSSNEDLYIHKQVLCYSNNLNLVYAVSITSQNKINQTQERIGQSTNTILFPEKHLHPSKKYIDKPVILISSRVHPGQSPSSWAAEGILQFLIGNTDEAKLIRQKFQVIVVPMLNPDGVEEGLYRLDTKGHNLNRYYLASDNRQPSIYCMKHLIKHYHQTKRLLYYFDLHGHPSQKGSFLYGNAIDQFPFQVETELFARLMSLICPTFEEKFCIFDREQMTSKDKYDQYTKEGCARVFAFKMASILHSYTIQIGFHGLSNPNSSLLYDKEHYYHEGRSILTSVLISCGLKQPPEPISLHALRKDLAIQICSRDERFKRQQRNLSQKKQKVNEIVQNSYWRPIIEQHFTQSNKNPHTSTQKKRFKLHKKETFSHQLQSFYSHNINEFKDNSAQKEDKTSLGDLLEETKNKLETTNFVFKTQKNNQTLKSTITTKTDLELPKERNVLKLAKLTSKPSIKPPSQPSAYREKFRSLRKACLNSRLGARDQQQIFGDMNMRSQVGSQGLRRNKIYSLFIQTHN